MVSSRGWKDWSSYGSYRLYFWGPDRGDARWNTENKQSILIYIL